MDELLVLLNELENHAQGYIDDITILISEKLFQMISELVQVLSQVEEWEVRENLMINPKKTIFWL